MKVAEIWRYPVKSMGGERLDRCEITELGVAFDRGWGVRDVETGKVLTGRRQPKLLLGSARVRDGELSIITDTGAVIGGDLTDMSLALSGWLGQRVELVPAGEQGGTYEVPLDIDQESDWVEWTGPGGAFHDSTRTRVSLLSRQSAGTIDVRRFRANLILDLEEAGPDERSLVEHEVSVGAARLSVVKHIDRCIMVARPQPGLDADLDALKHVIREHDNLMGVGALVTREGWVEVGDEVAF